MAILTISRQFGSRGDEMARVLACRIGFRLVTRDTVEEMMRVQYGVEPPSALNALEVVAESGRANGNGTPPAGPNGSAGVGAKGNGTHAASADFQTHVQENANLHLGLSAGAQAAEISLYADMVASVVADMAAREDMVLLGCGGQMILADASCAVHLRVVAPRAWRAASVAAELGLAPPAAAELVARYDARQARYMRTVFGRSAVPSDLYHLVVNTAALDVDQALAAAIAVIDSTQLSQAGLLSAQGVERAKVRSKMRLARRFADLPGSMVLEHAPFAHPSERVFARLMDFYGIDWEYEPRTFPVEWNERHDVTEAFTPDFYLPEMDLYVELTTMRQSLVTRKNRKVKRLRQIYPEVNIRVFYQKDVEDLIFKLGVPPPGAN